jgi:hypothetical protein
MSEQQVGRLEALLAKVQKNRQAPRGGVHADSGISLSAGAGDGGRGVLESAPERPRAAVEAPRKAEPPERAPAAPAQARPAVAADSRNSRVEEESVPPPLPAARPAAAQRPAVEASSPANQPIVPRVIEPDPPRTSGRPIAQLVSKHAPPVDATFGAMLKRSLSLRPH